MRRLALVVLAWVVVHPGPAGNLYALSVGEITVQSRLGEPLLATIPLVLQEHERQRAISATLGKEADYAAEGLKRAAVVEQLRLSPSLGGVDLLHVTSETPVHTTTFDLVVLVRVGQVTIVRTYGVRVPGSVVPPPATATPAPTAPPVHAEKRAVVPRRSPTRAAAPLPAPPPWWQRLPQRYGPVKSGETLFSIVKALDVPPDAIWQMAVLMWQVNTRQFSGGNIHGLLRGAYLAVPSDVGTRLSTLNQAEAQQVIAEHWEAWQSGQTLGPREVREAPKEPETTAVTAAAQPQPAPTVVLPTEGRPSISVTELRTVLQGFEERLTRRFPRLDGGEGAVGFVSATELQTALGHLEERLMQRFQETLGERVVISEQMTRPAGQQTPSSPQQAAALESSIQRFLFATPYVLLFENALLFLFAVLVAWRWYQRH